MRIDIFDLKKYPQHLSQLAKWHHAEWSYLNPKSSLKSREQKMQSYLEETFIPSTFIAKTDHELIGSASIIENDMDTHPEMTPWLASVYVSKKYRHQRVGSRLVKYVMNQASLYNFDKLYLFTTDQEDFYKKLGWEIIKEETYRRCSVNIMST